LSSPQTKRIVWRLARPIDVCLAANGGVKLSQEKIELFKIQFGEKIEKPRPWGMVIVEDSNLKARLYSRTTSRTPNGKNRLSHEMHDSINCKIDQNGVVEIEKYVEIPRALWDSKIPKKRTYNNGVFSLICFCENPGCRRVDIEFLKGLEKSRDPINQTIRKS